MNVLSPTIRLHQSSVRLGPGTRGLLLIGAAASAVAICGWLRRGPRRVTDRRPLADRLLELAELRAAGLISPSEEAELRRRILALV